MKIFHKEKGTWSDKVNFVDQNNVFLGYDVGQSCCEHAGWYIANVITDKIKDEDYDIDLTEYYFDTSFRETLGTDNSYDINIRQVFKVTDGVNEKFIHLYNVHNGYYGHGFEFKIGDNIIESEYI